MLRIFTSVKIQRLRPGLNPQTWVPEASMLTTRPPKPSRAVKKMRRYSARVLGCDSKPQFIFINYTSKFQFL